MIICLNVFRSMVMSIPAKVSLSNWRALRGQSKGTWALGGHSCTWTLKYLAQPGTWVLGHSGTWALRRLGTQALGQTGTRSLRALGQFKEFEDLGTRGTLFSRLF